MSEQTKKDEPTLSLTFVNERDLIVQNSTDGLEHKGIPKGSTIKIARIQALLTGAPSERYHAHLVSITPDPYNFCNTGPRELGWEHSKKDDFGCILYPNLPHRIDIAFTPHNAIFNTVPCPLIFLTHKDFFINIPSEYIFEIQVSGPTITNPPRFKLKLEWKEDFNSLEAQQIA